MERFFGERGSDKVVLAPASINPKADPSKVIEEFKLQGKLYRRVCFDTKTVKQANRDRRSLIWKWGEEIKLVGTTKGKEKESFYYCYLCEKESRQQKLLVLSSGNSPARKHCIQDHSIDENTHEINPEPSSNQPTIEDYPKAKDVSKQRHFDTFKHLLVRWIVYCHIAFFQFENSYFRALLFFLAPILIKYLPEARDTIRKWVMTAWQQKKAKLKAELKEAKSLISISFDLWTSPNGYAVLGVIGHFINKYGERRHVVLGLRQVVGEHSGENQAAILLALFKEYEISGKIGYFMCDNADNNDTCVEKVLRVLYPLMTKKQRKGRRLRCFGHIVNLVAQAFIVGKDADKVCKRLATAYREQDFKTVETLWKKRGAIGLLHTIVRYIRYSPQRRGFFKQIRMEGKLAEFDGLEVS